MTRIPSISPEGCREASMRTLAYGTCIMQRISFVQNNQQGSSVLELIIYLVVSSILTAGTYQIFYAQSSSYKAQNHVVAIQQSLRSGMELMTRELRSAGYDPQGKAQAGFVKAFKPPHDKFTIDYATAKNMIAFTLDADGNGRIGSASAELIAYRFNAAQHTLEKFNPAPTVPGQDWDRIIDNVDAVNFVYFQSNGTRATQPENIRFVDIALLVRSKNPDVKFVETNIYRNRQGEVLCSACTGDHYRRRLLTTTVQSRNIR